MRIAILVPDLVRQGGGERQLLELARRLVRRGHRVGIYTNAYDREACYPQIADGLSIVSVGLPWYRRIPNTFFALDYVLKSLAMRRLARHVPEDIDVINAHPYPGYIGALALKSRCGAPVVYHSNDLYLLTHQWIGGVGQNARRSWTRFFGFNRWPCLMYERAMFKKLDRVIVSCRWLQESIQKLYGVSAAIVPAGTDVDKFQPAPRDEALRSRWKASGGDIVLLSLNSLLPHRRYEDIIDAVALLRKKNYPVKLWIVGKAVNPKYSAFLAQRVLSLGLNDHVLFAGAVPEADLQRCHHASDLFVFAAEWESWSLTVTEAMACRKPVLMSRTSGNDEFFEDGRHTLFFNPRQPADLAEKIERLLQNSGAREQMAERGYREVLAQYTWDHYADKIFKEFEAVARIPSSAHRPARELKEAMTS